ncbi:hypothetical protein HZC00_01230 [Candidatus Kaiserbacteria bacterium]|nr:hypothetical protein [Candidatus Kaiserbacteria bacterium]
MQPNKTTPKDFFLWVGAMVALYASVFAFIALIFGYLDHLFPDRLSYYTGDAYSGSISYEMAVIIVLFPVFLALMRVIRSTIMQDVTRRDIWVRRWALFLTLFIAGAAMAGDLITLIMYFLNGDVTIRFILKVVVLLLVSGGVFMHFLADLRGYWDQNPARAKMLGWAAGVVLVITIVAGFFIVGTPWQARLYRYDDQKVSDLQNIQYQIVNYWQSKEMLPVTLADLVDPISGFMVPVDPQTGEAYRYQATGMYSFQICADFNAETQQYSANGISRPIPAKPMAVGSTTGGPDLNAEPWTHGAGEKCFERTIDPDRYPPFSKQKNPTL